MNNNYDEFDINTQRIIQLICIKPAVAHKGNSRNKEIQ